jgi:hypothetical protein
VRAFVSEHRFRLILAFCVVALILMTGAIYATVGLNVTWNASAGPGR